MCINIHSFIEFVRLGLDALPLKQLECTQSIHKCRLVGQGYLEPVQDLRVRIVSVAFARGIVLTRPRPVLHSEFFGRMETKHFCQLCETHHCNQCGNNELRFHACYVCEDCPGRSFVRSFGC